MSRILGIDPGSRATGYGIISIDGQKYHCIACGYIHTHSENFGTRLQKIYQGLKEIIQQYHPTQAAMEKIFLKDNPQTALKLGEARGAARVAIAECELALAEYTPREIKQAIVGYGSATKLQVQHMIARLFNLQSPLQADTADALAVALCHAHVGQVKQRLAQAVVTAGKKL